MITGKHVKYSEVNASFLDLKRFNIVREKFNLSVHCFMPRNTTNYPTNFKIQWAFNVSYISPFDRLIHSHQGFTLSSWQALLSLCMHWNAWTGVYRVSHEVMAKKPQGWGRDLGCLWAERCQITPSLSYIWHCKDHYNLTMIQNNGFCWTDKIIRL